MTSSNPAIAPRSRVSATAIAAAPGIQGDLPEWASLIGDDRSWSFVDGKLIHSDAPNEDTFAVRPACRKSVIQRLLVNHVWAAQKNSLAVKRVLSRLLGDLRPGQWGLNLGSGDTDLHNKILNLDIYRSKSIDIVNAGDKLPFIDDSLNLVISQEVLEHVKAPERHIREALRVLKPGGRFYCQLPFIIGYHPGPCDFWRFTKESYRELFPTNDWRIEELDLSLGHGSGFYRILVEFLAVNASLVSDRLYLPVKGLGSLLFYPLQWLDRLTKYSKQKDRIPGGYYCVATKK